MVSAGGKAPVAALLHMQHCHDQHQHQQHQHGRRREQASHPIPLFLLTLLLFTPLLVFPPAVTAAAAGPTSTPEGQRQGELDASRASPHNVVQWPWKQQQQQQQQQQCINAYKAMHHLASHATANSMATTREYPHHLSSFVSPIRAVIDDVCAPSAMPSGEGVDSIVSSTAYADIGSDDDLPLSEVRQALQMLQRDMQEQLKQDASHAANLKRRRQCRRARENRAASYREEIAMAEELHVPLKHKKAADILTEEFKRANVHRDLIQQQAEAVHPDVARFADLGDPTLPPRLRPHHAEALTRPPASNQQHAMSNLPHQRHSGHAAAAAAAPSYNSKGETDDEASAELNHHRATIRQVRNHVINTANANANANANVMYRRRREQDEGAAPPTTTQQQQQLVSNSTSTTAPSPGIVFPRTDDDDQRLSGDDDDITIPPSFKNRTSLHHPDVETASNDRPPSASLELTGIIRCFTSRLIDNATVAARERLGLPPEERPVVPSRPSGFDCLPNPLLRHPEAAALGIRVEVSFFINQRLPVLDPLDTDPLSQAIFLEVAVLLNNLYGGLDVVSHVSVFAPITEWSDAAFTVLTSVSWGPRVTFAEIRASNAGVLRGGLFATMRNLTAVVVKVPSVILARGVFNRVGHTLVEIDMAECQFREVPTGVFDPLTRLEWLLLDSNNITSISPSAFSALTSLQHLHLQGNLISQVATNSFVGLSRLRELLLDRNFIRTGVADFARHLPALEDLWLQGNAIEVISPHLLSAQTNLRILYLQRNNIRNLHGNLLASTTQLRVLFLQENALTTIQPRLFFKTTRLLDLDLSHNQLVSIPVEAFLQLSVVESIALNDNRLFAIDAALFQGSPNLVGVSLQRNQLYTLPDGLLANLPQLSFVWLHRNQLTRLPESLFSQSTNLQDIWLHFNLVSSLPPRIFEGLTRLHTLWLQLNEITALPERLFAGTPALEMLLLQRNQLRALPERVFAGLSTLFVLQLNNNRLTSLAPGTFDGLSELYQLTLHGNKLTSLHRHVFRTTTSLFSLDLDRNKLTSIHPDLFQNLHELDYLDISRNHALSVIPAGAFRSLSFLEILYMHNCGLETLSPNFFQGLPRVRQVLIHDNAISSIPATLFHHLPIVELLFIHGNAITQIPSGAFDRTTHLNTLFLQENPLSELPRGLFQPLPSLEFLSVAEMGLTSLAVDTLSGNSNLLFFSAHGNRWLRMHADMLIPCPKLIHLSASGIRALTLGDDMPFFQSAAHIELERTELVGRTQLILALQRPHFHLRSLTLGWRGMDERFVPFRQICNYVALSSSIDLLGVTGTSYEFVDACVVGDLNGRIVTITALVLRDNPLLHTVIAGRHIMADFSGCPRLASLQMESAEYVDVSETSLPFSPLFCLQLGFKLFFANNLRNPAIPDRARDLLDACFRFGGVFDFSNNQWLSNLGLINSIAPRNVVLGSFGAEKVGVLQSLDLFSVRETIPSFIIEGTPIQCRIEFEVFSQLDFNFRTMTIPSFSLHCRCSSGHRESGDICVSTALSRAAIAGIALGTTLFFLAIGLVFVYKWRVRTRKEKYKLIEESELKEQLLGEEVEALKQAWRIGLGELDLVCKVDEGAFGEVWRAQWDGVVVAVKFMKYASLGLMDPLMLSDFDKELEFLRRARHPHLVRFFGTGIDAHNAPFIVLEFVDLGSLRTLIFETGLQAALSNYHQRTRAETAAGSLERRIPSVRVLKLRLVLDIAKGMAFLHSLNVVHRDLKSGNVLVTNRLVAKITDFGSMSWRLKSKKHTQGQASVVQGLDDHDYDDDDDEDESSDGNRAHQRLSAEKKLAADSSFGDRSLFGDGEDASAKVAMQSIVPMHLPGNALASIHSTNIDSEEAALEVDGGVVDSPSVSGHDDESSDGQDKAGQTRILRATMTAGVGTPMYMAPEALMGFQGKKKLTLRTDVFSFGVILWEVQMCQVPDLVEQNAGDIAGEIAYLQALYNLYSRGKRLMFPDGQCTAKYARLTGRCVEFSAKDRPTFTAIVQDLEQQLRAVLQSPAPTAPTAPTAV